MMEKFLVVQVKASTGPNSCCMFGSDMYHEKINYMGIKLVRTVGFIYCKTEIGIMNLAY
jgi:hypothetical protein